VASNPLTLQAIDLVRRTLHDQTAQNVELDAVTVTGEGPEVGIILIPHRDLGGYSLIVWVNKNRISLSWGGVTDLSYHDDIDLAKPAFAMDGPGWASNDVVREALDAEMNRPIRITVRRTHIRRQWQLWCAVELSGQLAPSFVQDVSSPSMPSKDRIVEIGTTSLVGPERPPTRWPVPLAAWRRWADPAWPLGT
jgi:hypothetical protein